MLLVTKLKNYKQNFHLNRQSFLKRYVQNFFLKLILNEIRFYFYGDKTLFILLTYDLCSYVLQSCIMYDLC